MSEVAVKNASQLRSANACPVPDEPAFMMSGRLPPTGLGNARTPLSLNQRPSKSNVPGSVQQRCTTDSHSSAYS